MSFVNGIAVVATYSPESRLPHYIASSLCWCVLNLYINGLLVRGASNNQPHQVRRWLIYYGIRNTLLSIGVIVMVVIAYTWSAWWVWIVLEALGGSALVGLFWYCIVLYCTRSGQSTIKGLFSDHRQYKISHARDKR